MTVEIAIMNLEAVALATDSAVTASAGDSKKIFGSQNKLFALSDVAPVGILVYGGASFMSIPWEVLIKEYRQRKGRTTFPKLDDYVTDFRNFLVNDICGQIDAKYQAAYAESLIRLVYRDVANRIDERVTAEMDDILVSEEGSTLQRLNNLVEELTADVVLEYSRQAGRAALVEDAPDDFLARIRESTRRRLPELRQEFFRENLRLGVVRRLNTIATRAVGAMVDDVMRRPTGMTTGIVIAGFGSDDLFPSYSEVRVEGLVVGVLKKRVGRRNTIGPDNQAIIVPFAQGDMIHQFMQGISPGYYDYLHQSILSHLESYSRHLLETLGQLLQFDKSGLLEVLQDIFPRIANSFVDQVVDVGRYQYAREIVDVVAMLPKDQLGELAEALVNLTSLKRRVSLEDETVGGPTDVAIITKGDGLVWVKRKHYFPAELNPAYFARKYGKGGEEYAGRDR